MIRTFLLFISSLLLIHAAWAGAINTWLTNAMHAYKVPVVSYVIIDHGRIINAKAISIDPKFKVTPQTLFQAASISKSLTAYGALTLVAHKKLALDKLANHYLTSWKIPDNPFTQGHPVLIKELMDMTGGLSVSGFPGYPQNAKLPTALDILNGTAPANTQSIRVFYQPGSRYFYSGGGYQVLQQVVTDLSQQNFNLFMNQQVLKPIGMTNSLYQYPLMDKRLLNLAAPGFTGWSDKKIKGGWYNYKCAGACGMWSTPTDLAKFLLNVSHSFHGKPNGLIPQSLAKQMLTRQKNTDFGLGVVVGGHGKGLYFWKAGHNYGYHSLIIMFPNTGKGLAIMTNSESGDMVINYFVSIIAHEYHWPYYFPFFDELVQMPNFKES